MKNIIIATISVLALATFSCKHNLEKKNEVLGPRLVAASANLKVVDNSFKISNLLPNFDLSQEVKITAKMNESVTWKLIVKGLESSALKTYTSLSDSVNVSWKGESENIFFFRTGEKCVVELSFLGNSTVIKDTLEVGKQKRYGGKLLSAGLYQPLLLSNGAKAYFVDDFELVNASASSDSANKLSDYFYSQADGPKPFYTPKYTEDVVQGKYCFYLSGKDNDNNTYCGSLNTEKLNAFSQLIPKGTSTKDLYVNLYVYGYGNKYPNSSLLLIAYEVDDSSIDLANSLSTNNLYLYNNKKNDAYSYRVAVNWEGWKFISIPYDQFLASVSTISGFGNKVKEADKFSGLGFSIDSFPNGGGEVAMKLDNIIVTVGGPFVQ